MDSHQLARRWFVSAAMLLAMGFASVTWAADAKKKATTVINTKKMCPSCSKKIVSKFRKIEGVADARADVKAKTFSVVPKSGRVLSPRRLWETVEKGGEQPVRLAGPSGTFTTKPKS